MGPGYGIPRQAEGREDGLRFRVYIGGELADEEWLRTGDQERVTAAANRQGHLCQEARESGRAWYLEVYDPASQEVVRFDDDSLGPARVDVVVILPPGSEADY